MQLFAQLGADSPTIDAAVASLASILDDLAKETPWLTEVSIAGNQLWRVLALCMTVMLTMTLGKLVRFALHRAANQAEAKSQRLVAVAFESLAGATSFLAFAIGLPIGLKFLILNATVASIANEACSVLMAAAIGWAAYCLVDVVDHWLRSFTTRTSSRLDDMLAPLVTKSIRASIAILVLVQTATILSDKPATSIIAGLGVGGLAIGLAAQDTIKNIFGSMMIFSDRPFELGDEISVDGNTGVVETVGFRSTRFRTGAGHVITIPNGDLASKAITNISRRRNLNRTLNLSLPFDIAPAKMERAIEVVKEILADHDGQLPSQPAKVTFNEITSTALNLQVQYWVHPPDGNRLAALNEHVNLEILRRFQAEEIPLALPRQRIELEKAA